MTVCIAAICQSAGYEMVVGVSDRRYTSGDWTYEPPQTKRYILAPHVAVLISGDVSSNVAMCNSTSRKLAESPTRDVGEMAKMCALSYSEYRRRQAERALLLPLGLTLETYRHERQNFVARMDDDLRRWQLEDSAIVAGISENGRGHIHTVIDPGWAICEDTVGFAAIGSGRRHAAAEFMRARYERTWSPARALLLVYRAKKSAEVDPFVGTETDMFIIASDVPTVELNEVLYNAIEEIHANATVRHNEATADADMEIEQYVTTFLSEQTEETVQQATIQSTYDANQVHGSLSEGEPEESP